jgi:hypothetical protein
MRRIVAPATLMMRLALGRAGEVAEQPRRVRMRRLGETAMLPP